VSLIKYLAKRTGKIVMQQSLNNLKLHQRRMTKRKKASNHSGQILIIHAKEAQRMVNMMLKIMKSNLLLLPLNQATAKIKRHYKKLIAQK